MSKHSNKDRRKDCNKGWSKKFKKFKNKDI